MVSPWRISFRYICRSRNCAPGWVRGYLSIQILSKEKDRNEQPSTEVGRLVLTALFLSGMTAIAYEILWQRLLVRTTGATLPAVSQIFCVFIGGLWAGSLLSIPILRKSAAPLRTYAFLELTIAVFAIVIPFVFGEQVSSEFLHALRGIVQSLMGQVHDFEMVSAIVQNILYFLVLFSPAVLMGVTFNCVTKFLEDSRSASGTSLNVSSFSLSAGYAINLFGGATGCLLVSFWLIPQVGLSISSMVMALVNLIAFFLLLLASLLSQKGGEPFAQLIALFSPPAKESVGEKIELPASSSEVLSFEPPVKSTEPASKIATIDAAEQKNVSAEHAIDDSLTMAVTSLTPVKRNEKRAAKKEAKLLAKRQAQQHAQQHANHSLNQQLGQQSDQPPAPASISAKANPGAKSATPGSQSAADDPPLGLLFAIFIALVSSGTIMVLEVAGTRLMMLLLGSSTYSLSCVLFSAFLAFALSAQFIAWRFNKYKDLKALIPPLLLISALAICGGMWLVQWLPLSLVISQRYLMQTFSNAFVSFVLPRLIICCVIFVPPLAVLGAIFPILLASTRRLQDNSDEDLLGSELKRTTTVGLLFAASSAGAIVGSLVTAYYLIPNASFDLNGVGSRSGVETTLSTMSLFLLFMAASVRVALRDKAKPVKSFVARSQLFMMCCMAAGYAICLRAPWDLLLLSLGPSYFKVPEHTQVTQEKLIAALREGNGGKAEPLFYKEGANSTVTVEQNASNNVRFLKTNGKIEAALPIDWRKPAPTSDASTQLILAGLPFYFLDKRKDVQSLIIGYGSGITSGAVDCRPESGTLKIAELEPAVYKASRWFITSNLDPFRSARKGAQKVWGLITDGRAFLRVHQATYDLIISQPSEPWVSGASDLFTKEFWHLASDRLNSRGVMCQWVQLYSIDQQTLSELIATFHHCFPDSYLVHPANAGEVLLIGIKEPRNKLAPAALNVEEVNKFLAADGSVIAPRLSPSGDKVTPPKLECDFMLDSAALMRLAGNSQLNTDDRLLPEYRMPSLVVQNSDNIAENLSWLNSSKP
jgi:predicted membrane-bound spermidine synthase